MSGQSPVDLTEGRCVPDDRPLQFEYSPVKVRLTDTGSPSPHATVKAKTATGSGLRFAGRHWSVSEFHWHIPSEHTFAGDHAAMELHVVHQDGEGGLLVVGVLADAGDWNAAAAPIFNGLPLAGERQLAYFELDRLVPAGSSSYRYVGSLTTPPHTGGVQWVVLSDRIELSHQQRDSFARLFPSGNAREVQRLGNRPIGFR